MEQDNSTGNCMKKHMKTNIFVGEQHGRTISSNPNIKLPWKL